MIFVKGVLFDLDGTLMDTAPDFYQTLHVLRDRYALPRLSEVTIRNHVSDGSRALTHLCHAHEEMSDALFESRRLELLDVYETLAGKEAKVFPEMDLILEELDQQNIPWGIVTNKPRLYTELILDRTKLNLNCKVLVCADDLSKAKPDPEGIIKASHHLGLHPGDVLYVGDHERDVIAGQRAGCPTAVVTFGYFDENVNVGNWNASVVITSLNDLKEQIRFS